MVNVVIKVVMFRSVFFMSVCLYCCVCLATSKLILFAVTACMCLVSLFVVVPNIVKYYNTGLL